MKKGFTLIELLVVTVIIAALAGIVFRLMGATGSSTEKATTIARMQRLENCLSGYYAAFGSYPPVPLQGRSRNVYRETTANGVQATSEDRTTLDWARVRNACQAQPIAATFPPPAQISVNGTTMSSSDAYDYLHQQIQAALESGTYPDIDDATRKRLGEPISVPQGDNAVDGKRDKTNFTDVQLWEFGLMSFLLPRFRFMLLCAKGADGQSNVSDTFGGRIDKYKQWTENNRLPCRMDTGIAYKSWDDFCKDLGGTRDWEIDLVPSQAACARWLPNLEGIVSGKTFTFMGVTIGDSGHGLPPLWSAPSLRFYNAGSSGSSATPSAGGYLLQKMTVYDGWYQEFYYYSPPPYQTYVLWSAGANGKTFPPWIDMEQLKKDNALHAKTATEWASDDIVYMSN